MSKRREKTFWSVLMTKQPSSSDARANLRNQGFEYFHPQYRKRAVRSVRTISPLFPYYLIVKLNEHDNWRVLFSTRGVRGMLMDGEVPGRVPDECVNDLRVLTDDTHDGYYSDPKCEHPRFDPGAPVLGLRGLFAEKFGTYKGLAGNNAARVRVLFSILGREAEFEVRADDLIAA